MRATPYVLLVAPALVGAALAGSPALAATAATPPSTYLPSDKSGFVTSRTAASPVWLTVQKEGGLGEVFYPDLGTPAARSLRFTVADPGQPARPAESVADVTTSLPDDRSLTYRQTYAARSGDWRLTTTYVTDPAGPGLLVDVALTVLDGRRHVVRVVYDPSLGDDGSDDRGTTRADALVASDARTASALVASPAFAAGSTHLAGGGPGTGPADIRQTGELGFARGHATVALGFAPKVAPALAVARRSLARGVAEVSRSYAAGWHAYLAGLASPPASLRDADQVRLYRVSAMVLAASEDKAHPGAYVASPTMPWRWGQERPSGPYHLVWSRDLYQIASSLAVAGDVAGANRALDYLLDVQQKPDGSFPQNSTVAGTPFWTGLQLDEVALPIVLADQLGRSDARTWSHVRRAADFLLGFSEDGYAAPWSPQERWENQSGYSPATIASEIAGLVCAAEIARANGDSAASGRYLATADRWQARVKSWTVTTTGPYSAGPYFLRLTKDGRPDAGTTYTIGDSGPADVDQRRVVDPSFLDLVRLGVLPAADRAVVNSLGVIDAQLGVATPRGFYWHRASFDGYGEMRNGDPWDFGFPDGSRVTLGRAWPLLSGERGEYQIAAGDLPAASSQLTAMTRAAGPGLMLPEQVWDERAPAGQPGFVAGTPTNSATPLAWTHAQFLRLAWDVQAGRVLEQPAVVARRYAAP